MFLATGSSNLRDQPGIRHTEEGLLPDQVVTFDGIRVTVPVRSLFHEMRRARDAREAARLAAMAAFNDLVAADELEEFITLVGPVEGIGKVREALILMDENCWSPEEAGMLMVWVLDAGLPRPLMNTPIFDRSGRHVGTPDLLDPVAGVAGEYEGVLHLAGKQRAKDIAREALFRDFGLEYFTMLREDKADTTSVVARMLGARRRAKFLGQEARPWSIEPPRWWKPTLTVAQRRTLSDADRARLLAHRRLAA